MRPSGKNCGDPGVEELQLPTLAAVMAPIAVPEVKNLQTSTICNHFRRLLTFPPRFPVGVA